MPDGVDLKLSKDAFTRAEIGISKYGRKLEQLRFHHHFVEPIPDEVAAKLTSFQNQDGGFGHGLEPDFWLPESSPMATSVGLQIAVELELEASHPIVTNSLRYLRSTYDTEMQGWVATSSAVNDHPHAPWWYRDPDKALDSISLRLNPSSEIVGYLLRWGEDDWQQWVQELIEGVDELEPHQLLCCFRLLEAPRLADTDRANLFTLISRVASSAIETDPDSWGGYCIKPLSAIQSPDAPLARDFATELESSVRYLGVEVDDALELAEQTEI